MTKPITHEQKVTETLRLKISGVRLILELDYDEGTVSFVDADGTPESFKFAGRGRNYLGGWLKIFQAFEIATRLANEKLAEQEQLRKKANIDEYVEIWEAIRSPRKDGK